jgi:Flp pilus assembly protein TadG
MSLAERGSVTTEFAVVVAAVLLGFFALAIFGGRVVQAENDVRSAAHAAARAASLQADPNAGVAAATEVATVNLVASGVVCANGLDVVVDTDRFAPGGEVTVQVACDADFADVGSLGVPGSRIFRASATEVIDLYRQGAS